MERKLVTAKNPITEIHNCPLAAVVTFWASQISILYLFNNAASVNPPINKKTIELENGAKAAFGSRIWVKYARTGTSKAVAGNGTISVIHRPAQTNKTKNPF